MNIASGGFPFSRLSMGSTGNERRSSTSGTVRGEPLIPTGVGRLPDGTPDIVTSNYFQLGRDFQEFVYRLDGVLDTMRSLRSDIVDGDYDLIHDQGRLKVTDSTLDKRSVIWLEESLNGDPELVRLAGSFNDQVVRTFDTERGRWDETGKFRRTGDGYTDNGRSRNYSGLSATVGRTTKFMSPLRDLESIDMRLSPGDNRFCRTGLYMEKYIEKDIVQYQASRSGVDVVRSAQGQSMFGWMYEA